MPETLTEPEQPDVDEPSPVAGGGRLSLWWGILWAAVVAAGTAALLLAGWDQVPGWVGDAGTVAVTAGFAVALTARVGGPTLVFGALALVLSTGVLITDIDLFRTGAAVLVCVLSGLCAVMATRPASHLLTTLREVFVSLVVSAIGALATVGYDPVADVARFRFVTLALAVVIALALVYRLGAGLHGLGRRGLAFVVVAGMLAAVALVYAELLQAYSDTFLVKAGDGLVDWSHEHFDTFPAPVATLLGIPALVWGTYLRSRRRQGWWVCAFGVAATVPFSYALVLPDSWREIGLRLVATLIVGLLIGMTIALIDRRLSERRARRGARRARQAERQAPQPEPGRWRTLR